MKEFFYKLVKGVARKDIPRDKRNLVNQLIQLGILENGAVIKLHPDYRVGEVDLTRKGFGFLIPLGVKERDYLIEVNDLHGASDGDLVIARKLYRRKRGRAKVEVVYLLEKRFPVSVVYLQFLKKGGKKIPVLKNIKTEEPIFIKKSKQLKKLPEGAVFKLDNYTNTIVEVLGVLSDPWVDEKISLALYNRPVEFSKKAIYEAEALGDYVEKEFYPHRRDLTHLPFITIDPEGAKDHDDAIYYDPEKGELFVAIADVSEYVYLNSNIDREAKERGFSVYFPHKAIPMLPPQLSENLCSLKAGEDRLAFIWRLKLDQSGNVVEEELFEGIIRVVKGYTYPEVDRYLAGESGEGEVDRQVLEWLLPLYRLTQTIRERRLKKGMTFISDEVRLKLDPAGEIAEVELERETPSHMLIEECMLLANQAAARIIDYGIFRVHPSPSATSLEELYSALESLGIRVDYDEKEFPKLVVQIQEQAEELGIRPFVDKLIIKAQQQAHYSAENSGHFALGFEKYTHFTSPIRRYSDLTLHRLLKAILKKDRRLTEYILRNIESLAVKISQLEREAQKVEWDFYDRKFARWAAKRIGERVEGVVEDPEIPPIGRVTEQIPTARIFLENRERYPLFQRVQIEITDANIATAKIKGRVVEKLPSPHLPPAGEGEGEE